MSFVSFRARRQELNLSIELELHNPWVGMRISPGWPRTKHSYPSTILRNPCTWEHDIIERALRESTRERECSCPGKRWRPKFNELPPGDLNSPATKQNGSWEYSAPSWWPFFNFPDNRPPFSPSYKNTEAEVHPHLHQRPSQYPSQKNSWVRVNLCSLIFISTGGGSGGDDSWRNTEYYVLRTFSFSSSAPSSLSKSIWWWWWWYKHKSIIPTTTTNWIGFPSCSKWTWGAIRPRRRKETGRILYWKSSINSFVYGPFFKSQIGWIGTPSVYCWWMMARYYVVDIYNLFSM